MSSTAELCIVWMLVRFSVLLFKCCNIWLSAGELPVLRQDVMEFFSQLSCNSHHTLDPGFLCGDGSSSALDKPAGLQLLLAVTSVAFLQVCLSLSRDSSPDPLKWFPQKPWSARAVSAGVKAASFTVCCLDGFDMMELGFVCFRFWAVIVQLQSISGSLVLVTET